MTQIDSSTRIAGLQFVHLDTYSDERGRFSEIFRKEWFPQRSWKNVQCNRSRSVKGVLRGLHYHHSQVDFWHVLAGTIRAGLVDLRHDSPTFLAGMTVELRGDKGQGLYIPTGVAHGFFAITDAMLFYVVDNYYDGSDELGLAWDDPNIGLEWGVANPLISDRDKNNPRFEAIDKTSLPLYVD